MNTDLLEIIERGLIPSTEAILLAYVVAFLIPALVFLTATLKLFKQRKYRPLHVFLAITSGLILMIGGLEAWGYMRPQPSGLGGANPMTWLIVLLYAWMTLDFFRSALRTGFRPRATDLAVLMSLLSALVLFALVLSNAGARFT